MLAKNLPIMFLAITVLGGCNREKSFIQEMESGVHLPGGMRIDDYDRFYSIDDNGIVRGAYLRKGAIDYKNARHLCEASLGRGGVCSVYDEIDKHISNRQFIIVKNIGYVPFIGNGSCAYVGLVYDKKSASFIRGPVCGVPMTS